MPNARTIWISDDKKRDAQVEFTPPAKLERHSYVLEDGRSVKNEQLVRATEGHTLADLRARFKTDGALTRALVDGDPEIDLFNVGRKVGNADRVWISQAGQVLYSARRLQVVFDSKGVEKSRADFVDVEATVTDETPLPWSGKLFPITEVVRKFALLRKLQLRHVNGLTFDFLLGIAKTLQESKKMLLVTSKGGGPLVFQTNGSPYRGFLEGRVNGESYLLLLHLSNLELKAVQP